MIVLLMMLFGAFSREWFRSGDDGLRSTLLELIFLLYLLLVSILMFNVLIALVGDSYDYARMRSQRRK